MSWRGILHNGPSIDHKESHHHRLVFGNLSTPCVSELERDAVLSFGKKGKERRNQWTKDRCWNLGERLSFPWNLLQASDSEEVVYDRDSVSFILQFSVGMAGCEEREHKESQPRGNRSLSKNAFSSRNSSRPSSLSFFGLRSNNSWLGSSIHAIIHQDRSTGHSTEFL